MEKPVPMDRVVMGDVGYGKTEIAVRAAFKAVQDGKQVADPGADHAARAAALRHLPRPLPGLPVKVRAVSRFNSDREQKEVMDGVRDGSVDVVIGTHRLLSKETKFKDLGLGHRRRGAALRRRAQGVHQADADGGGRADDVRDSRSLARSR
jgi:transcription-repair coupling factor (superfamily II helicase)